MASGAPRAPARALGPPVCVGLVRSTPEDFQVDELLGFRPDGRGFHTLARVRKIDANTEWVARRLARIAGVPARDIGYCGLKDRRAVTTQWFSIPGGPIPDTEDLRADGIEILEQAPHGRKLRRGSHAGNHFRLQIRQIEGPIEDIESRLKVIGRAGVPNYFGEQRFGHGGRNLELARAMAAGQRMRRRERGFALSAARAAIFNRLLSLRVERRDWDRLKSGDLAILDGTGSWFHVERLDPDLKQRLERLDLHPSGPLWGEGEPATSGEILALESSVASELEDLVACVRSVRMRQDRRALRLPVRDLAWSSAGGGMTLSFRLPRGAFATAVLGELTGAAVPRAGQRPDFNST